MRLYVGLSDCSKNFKVDPPATQPNYTVSNATSSLAFVKCCAVRCTCKKLFISNSILIEKIRVVVTFVKYANSDHHEWKCEINRTFAGKKTFLQKIVSLFCLYNSVTGGWL